jgi:hypothetical protein
MRYWEICESKWWDNEPTIRLYHGTSSAFIDHVKEHGLRPPKEDLLEYALEVLEAYIPRSEWTDKLIENVREHAARTEMGRVGDRGSVLYFFPESKSVEGYARSYAKHGGEIAYDVYNSACMHLSDPDISWKEFKANPPIKPRFHDGSPVVVEVEVPKSWCLTDYAFDEFRSRMTAAWNEGKAFARKFPTLEDFLDDVLDNREIRIGKTIPPHMIVSIREVTDDAITEKVEMVSWHSDTLTDTRTWRNPSVREVQSAMEASRHSVLRGYVTEGGDLLVWDAYDASHEDMAVLSGDGSIYEPIIIARSAELLQTESDWDHGQVFRAERGGFYLLGDFPIKDSMRVQSVFGRLEHLSTMTRT